MRHYYTNTQGIIFIFDLHDRDRIDDARKEIHKIINDEELNQLLKFTRIYKSNYRQKRLEAAEIKNSLLVLKVFSQDGKSRMNLEKTLKH
jgi:GTPase SAR1 family protein